MSQKLPQCNNELSTLFVEDNHHARETVIFLLKLYLEKIDVVCDGVEGMKQYQHYYETNGSYYDIVITDVFMPKLNGIEMIRQMLTYNARQQFIVVSADNEARDLIALMNMGVSNFLLKPITPPAFKQTIERAIDICMDRQKLERQYKEIKMMNEKLQLVTQHAEGASRQKSEFLANMSHEIRTPLNAINGFISLLKQEENDPTKRRYIEIIEESSMTLLQIISDILDISKIENGKLEVEAVNFNPYHDLIMVTELFQAKAAEKNILFNVQYNHSMPEVLKGDVLRIKQVLSNLLSNAIKFTPEYSKIKCVIWCKNNMLYIKVKDYGIGIARDKQQHVFHAFMQADSSTVRQYGGTGLGLSISYRLSKLLNGDLTLKSELGKGSAFLFSATVTKGDKNSLMSETEEHAIAPGKKVLLVEDNRSNQLFMSIVLKKLGLKYALAKDGYEAVNMVKIDRYDLILMDENMPRLNGIGATKLIREYEKEHGYRHIPIISLTANAIKGDKERFLQSGMDDYLAKPIDQEKLLNVMRPFL